MSRALYLLPILPLGALLAAVPSGANALSVGRCNALIDGVYRPVLVVQDGETRSLHPVGDDGLTRSIVFNPVAAMDWAAQNFGADPASVSYADACHVQLAGKGDGRSDAPVVTADPVDVDDEDDGDDYGGGGDDSPAGGADETLL
jgi:hypothetical protein